MTATTVHPRDPETGQIGREMSAEDFVREYLNDNSRVLKYFL